MKGKKRLSLTAFAVAMGGICCNTTYHSAPIETCSKFLFLLEMCGLVKIYFVWTACIWCIPSKFMWIIKEVNLPELYRKYISSVKERCTFILLHPYPTVYILTLPEEKQYFPWELTDQVAWVRWSRQTSGILLVVQLCWFLLLPDLTY